MSTFSKVQPLSAELPQTVRQVLGEEAAQDMLTWLNNRFSFLQVRVTPFIARQKVNVLVSERVSGLFLAGEPTLIEEESGSQVWRVPVDLTLPKRGRVGRVGQLEVDAYYGQVHVNKALLEQMAQRAEQLMDQLDGKTK